jgi:serine protease SohB
MEFLAQYGLFLAKSITLVVAILLVAGGLVSLIMKSREKSTSKLNLQKLNKKYASLRDQLQQEILPKKNYNKWLKTNKKALKIQTEQMKSRVFVLHFDGDIKASGVTELREEITAIITLATPKDEVVVCLESGGGVVHGYGLAASQLQRLRERGIPLTIIIDKIAASGGYMMACVANKIIAAPFAIIGSIGVMMQLPNFSRWLKKNTIDYEQLTAGQFKRTLTLFGENTDSGRQKMQQELERSSTYLI